MKGSELKRMKRDELQNKILDLSKENEELKKKCEELENKLNNRRIGIKNSGSIAEASMQLSGIFESAQLAANSYLENIKYLRQDAELESEQLLKNTRVMCEKMKLDAKQGIDAKENGQEVVSYEMPEHELVNANSSTEPTKSIQDENELAEYRKADATDVNELSREETASSVQPATSEEETVPQKPKKRFKALKVTLLSLASLVFVLVVSSVIILSIFPPMIITGTSMEPNMSAGDIVLINKKKSIDKGDIVAFNYNDKILLKRIIAEPNDSIKIQDDGSVYDNGQLLNEDYVLDKSKGQTDIAYPFIVPDGEYFVMGDNRKVSIDSRLTTIGCVKSEDLIGAAVFKVWPMKKFGKVNH